MNKEKAHKVTFTLSKKALGELMFMKEALDSENLAEVVRSALCLNMFLIKKKLKGWKTYVIKGNRELRINMKLKK